MTTVTSQWLTFLITCFLLVNVYGISLIDPINYNHNIRRIRRQTITSDEKGNGTCITPPQPAFGKWIKIAPDGQDLTGQTVGINTIIAVSCNEGYKLSSTNNEIQLITCLQKGWQTEMPRCEKLCPSISSYSTVIATCKDLNTGLEIPCNRASTNTILRYRCPNYYELSGPSSPIFCSDGSWSSPIPQCIPVCGQKQVGAQPLSISGSQIKRGDYPWTVAIYSNHQNPNTYINICGGNLLTPSLILTAAHCVTSNKGKVHNISHFQVAVGKYYNEYNDQRDANTAQYAKVDHIEIHPNFKGAITNQYADIAIVRVEKPFELSAVVQPVCFNGINDLNPALSTGVLSVWNHPSGVVEGLEVPYYDQAVCTKSFDNNFLTNYFVSDKVCIKFIIEYNTLCKGYSGSGVAIKHPQTGRFFIYGIISVGPFDNNNPQVGCSANRSVLATSVPYYYEWLAYKIHLLRNTKY